MGGLVWGCVHTPTMPLSFSERAHAALRHSRAEAVRLGGDAIGTEYLLLGLLREGGMPVRLLRGLGVSIQHLKRAIEAALPGGAAVDPGDTDLALTAEAEEALASAELEAADQGLDSVGAEWVLAGVFGDEHGIAARVLHERFGLTAAEVRAEVLRLHGIEPPGPTRTVQEPEEPYLLDRAASASHRLSVVFDEAASGEDVAEVLALLSELYRALGGDGLVILDSGIPAWDAEGSSDG